VETARFLSVSAEQGETMRREADRRLLYQVHRWATEMYSARFGEVPSLISSSETHVARAIA
jgi:hypothetical protein